MGSPAAPDVRSAALTTLAADALAVEVTTALADAGVESILLKGASIAHALYEGALRPYDDVDLLVAPRTSAAAASVLEQLGFSAPVSSRPLIELHATPWSHPQRRNRIDLHRTLPGVNESPQALWRAFRREGSIVELAGHRVTALGPGALAFHTALHAAQHGPARAKALQDLQRAIERFGPSDWWRAAALARELNAVGAFITGLRLVPEGRNLVRRLRLEGDVSRETALRALSAPSGAITLARLASTRGLRAKLAGLRAIALPPAAFMRSQTRLARSGAHGLALAYMLRFARHAANVVAMALAWRTAGRSIGRRATPKRLGAGLGSGWWAWRAVSEARGQLKRTGPAELRIRPAPAAGAGGHVVSRILDWRHCTCLERAAVMREWNAAHGRQLDLVIGVRREDGAFEAHAWLAPPGGASPDAEGFRELWREGQAARDR